MPISTVAVGDSWSIRASVLQTGVDVVRPTKIRDVAGDVEEVTFFSTFMADVGRNRCCNEKAAIATFPVGQAALRTNVPDKPT